MKLITVTGCLQTYLNHIIFNTMVTGTSDVFIRYLLGSEKNSDLLLDFINAVLTDSGFDPIKKATIVNPFNLADYSIDKETILDIKAVSATDNIFDIEIQNHAENGYIKRSLYYWAQLYSNQLDEGDVYKELQPVICINLLSHIIFHSQKKAHSCFLITEKDEKENLLTDDLQINYLELPKFSTSYDIKDRLSVWAWFLRFIGKGEREKEMEFLLKQDAVMAKARRIYGQFTEDSRLRALSEARQKRLKDEASRLAYAREEGLQEGFEKGKLEGRKKKVEAEVKQATLDNARALKANRVPLETIAGALGLSIEEIDRL